MQKCTETVDCGWHCEQELLSVDVPKFQFDGFLNLKTDAKPAFFMLGAQDVSQRALTETAEARSRTYTQAC